MKIGIRNKKTVFISLAVIFLTFIVVANSANAGLTDWAYTIVGSIARVMVSALGWVLSKLMGILIYIAQYNDFIKSAAVTNGWVIARDVANMFFVVILLIIAFATILRIENYSYKKWLPKLILMAVLINFSKTICGLLIDLAQVVMLTFVNSFKDVAAGNLVEMLGIRDWQSLEDVGKITGWELVAGYILAVIYVIIALITVAAMVGMLVMRIIMIWVYVVLSPFAYLLSAFPGGEGYAKQWWSEFTKNLIVGPVLAFFIWLSFASMVNLKETNSYVGLGDHKFSGDSETADINLDTTNGTSTFGTSDLMVQFIVSIAMLLGGMKIAQEIGGAAGSVAGKGLTKVKNLGLVGAGAVGGFALARAKSAGRATVKATKAVGGVTLGTVDRLAGNALDKVNRTNRYGDRGLIATSVGAVATSAGKGMAQVKGWMAGSTESKELGKALRDNYADRNVDKNAVMPYNNRRYIMDEGTGNYMEVNQDDQPTGAVLSDSSGRAVKAMNAFTAARYDSFNKNMRPISNAADAKQAKKVDDRVKEISASGMSNGEMMRAMRSAATSVEDKMAYALALAMKNGFRSVDDVNEAKRYINTNNVTSDKFSDELDKKRPDLNYDFNSQLDVANFRRRLNSGKIDDANLAPEAYENGRVLEIIHDFRGEEFGNKIQAVASRNRASRNNLNNGLNNYKNILIARETEERASGRTQEADRTRNDIRNTASARARLSGEWQIAFTDQSQPNNFDAEGLGRFIGSASGKDLNRMSVSDYENLTNSNPEAKNQVLANITPAKLTAMLRDDTNNDLVRKIVDDIQRRARIAMPIVTSRDAEIKRRHDAILNNVNLTTI